MKKNNEGMLQKPVESGFDAASTASDVIKGIDLTGKTAIVTGGYAGIGLETTKTFAVAGATVVVPARDMDKAQKNLAGVPRVEILPMDLTDPASIDAFAERFLASGRALHLLINNAGIMWVPLQRDARGYESQLSANHLGHFHLTARLWPALKKAEGARVVNVSSWGHHFSSIMFEDPSFEHREFDTLQGYGQSKTANILFALELDNRGMSHGVRAFSLHPGAIIDTDLKRLLSTEDLIAQGLLDPEGNAVYNAQMGLKTIPQGASTTVWCATSPLLDDLGGVYCEDNEVAVLDPRTEPATPADLFTTIFPPFNGVTAYALDPVTAGKLWTLSERLTGVTFDLQPTV
ncbi:SDR family NAD(P)-dependent oxidoreductase [Cohnella lupini]|uniref:NAD(P)-dependent dehydrogenase (Short-subunit alcohol dehydrogenase family) n=1 Tax=Cohnella lupini TaxID=1294267 RepID=A0A3D9IX68_9BACL|nr:SDR family NAD(P)-dependent oxidoreductase [Cohnella lupini]RED66342.1 NAD(P)-dependent dehydrogenase (short-subunit alcohol dehydrogenase family) [Cohnella lupini]